MTFSTRFFCLFVYAHLRNAGDGFITANNITVKEVFILDRNMKRMLVNGQYLAISIKNSAPRGIEGKGVDTAAFRDTFIFVAFDELELKEPNDNADEQ